VLDELFMRRFFLAAVVALVVFGCGGGDATAPDDTDDGGPGTGGLSATFQRVGFGRWEGCDGESACISDLWVFGDYAYTGTLDGSGLLTWNVSDPTSPIVVHNLPLEAGGRLNDVKVSPDGSFAVVSHELSDDGLNGFSILSLANPATPSLISRYTPGHENGVHNLWIERIDGRDYVFTAVDGATPLGGIKIIDVTDRADPVEVSRYYAGSSFVHDVYVRNGLAFVSHWNAGLVILDVGNGIRGGSPGEPIEVSRIVTRGGNVHNAWYWPEGGYVFVGQEELPGEGEPIDSTGVVHVVDVSNLEQPREVATVSATENTPHNFWMDEENAILFVAWYTAGLRAVDVSGTLEGALERQGRLLAVVRPTGPGGVGVLWAPQLHRGVVFASDLLHGLWSFRLLGGSP
jgi:hypothetical protein